jgi:hypothetical protein
MAAEAGTAAMFEVYALPANEICGSVSEPTEANSTEAVPLGTAAEFFQSLGMDVFVCALGLIKPPHKTDEI